MCVHVMFVCVPVRVCGERERGRERHKRDTRKREAKSDIQMVYELRICNTVRKIQIWKARTGECLVLLKKTCNFVHPFGKIQGQQCVSRAQKVSLYLFHFNTRVYTVRVVTHKTNLSAHSGLVLQQCFCI